MGVWRASCRYAAFAMVGGGLRRLTMVCRGRIPGVPFRDLAAELAGKKQHRDEMPFMDDEHHTLADRRHVALAMFDKRLREPATERPLGFSHRHALTQGFARGPLESRLANMHALPAALNGVIGEMQTRWPGLIHCRTPTG